MDFISELQAEKAHKITEMARRIKQEGPTLADLSQTQLEEIARIVIAQRLTNELHDEVKVADISWINEKNLFFDNVGGSKYTKRGYRNALSKLEIWGIFNHINLLKLSPKQADNFIYSLSHTSGKNEMQGYSPATIRLIVAASSSFYNFLSRRYEIQNPFRGTKARPKLKATRTLEVPSAEEVKLILEKIPLVWSAAVSILSGLGLRCGALQTIKKNGKYWQVASKGKEFYIELSFDMLKRIKCAGLSQKEPFAGKTTNSIELMVAYNIKKLYSLGEIKAPYSCHDFRHFAAIREYEKDKDIVRVRDFLHHSSITTTEKYLRSIGIRI
jgi:integrase